MSLPLNRRGDESVRERAATERFAALLARVAYDVALRYGVAGSFADFELDLWRELQVAVNENIPGVCRPHRAAYRA